MALARPSDGVVLASPEGVPTRSGDRAATCHLCGASCSGIVRVGPAFLMPFSGSSLQIHMLPLTWSDLAYRYTFPEVWPVLLQADLRTARRVLSAPDFQAYDQ